MMHGKTDINHVGATGARTQTFDSDYLPAIVSSHSKFDDWQQRGQDNTRDSTNRQRGSESLKTDETWWTNQTRMRIYLEIATIDNKMQENIQK